MIFKTRYYKQALVDSRVLPYPEKIHNAQFLSQNANLA